jgi:gamma-glutamyltranspeptidase / glutathione hydrolase
LKQSLQPAYELASKGFKFGEKNTTMLGFRVDTIKKSPAASASFLRGGKAIARGEKVIQADLAKTIKMLMEQGVQSYYHGVFAEQLVTGVRAAGGIWTVEDLAAYKVVERTPLEFDYRGYHIVTAPPSSSGGIALAECLNILSGFDLAKMAKVPRTHVIVEAMRRAYRDRAIYLGDPDFANIPLSLLQSADYAAGLRASINTQKATPSDLLPGISAAPSGTDTSHFSIIDRDGNRVAVTQTVNLPFGSAFVAPGTGFLLNNEMDDFSVKPGVPNAFGLVGDDANAIAPGKRPLSSMTPTFLIGEDRIAVVGTPGGSRIISMVLIGLLELMDGRGAQATVDTPRFHHQYLPDVVSAESGALTAEEITALQARGFTVSGGERAWGNMQVVLWDRKNNRVETGSDSRWKGVGGGIVDEKLKYR